MCIRVAASYQFAGSVMALTSVFKILLAMLIVAVVIDGIQPTVTNEPDDTADKNDAYSVLQNQLERDENDVEEHNLNQNTQSDAEDDSKSRKDGQENQTDVNEKDDKEADDNEDDDSEDDDNEDNDNGDDDGEDDDNNDGDNEGHHDLDDIAGENNDIDPEEEQSSEPIDLLCSKGMCPMGIQPIGCFYDPVYKDRPLPILLDSHRDRTSHAFHGVVFKWDDAEGSIRRLACDCMKIAKKRGMTHFGLQHYGECWGSKTAALTYAKHGSSKKCVNGQYKPCQLGQFCVGQEHANYVYAINSFTDVACSTKYQKVGCFVDPVISQKRPLPELLVTHRDTSSHAYNGKLIDWRNYRSSLLQLLCLCAEKAKKKGYKNFGIQFYGECWSGPDSKAYNKYGSSRQCVNSDFQACDANSTCPCTGSGFSNFVYKLA